MDNYFKKCRLVSSKQAQAVYCHESVIMMNNIPKPSEMMRSRRPYLYSDSENIDAYQLSESELSHHLSSLTDRNQHKDFEVFARNLCEREICPNLRPQTGPEGGGDGKVDSESYPVDNQIAARWFVADARDGTEKWAFAVSAKEKWSEKVRSDVKEIAGTQRGYDKIIFATSRPARSKDRLRIEDELTAKYGIPVTIIDREWIIDRVFSHGHKDLAYQHLGAGSHDPQSVKLGPNDFKNQQALDAIEDDLRKMGTTPSELTQAVSATYEAANLSRRLERPRYETEGRFLRAIDFARKHGASYQELRAVYEYAWTRFWWFDDAMGMLEFYERVEDIAFNTDQAGHISKVCNLCQLIFSQVFNRQDSAENLLLHERSSRLRGKLQEMADDTSRPNNALYSETLLLFHDLNDRVLEGQHAAIDGTWAELSSIIDRAKGLGEYPASLLDSMVEALAPVAAESAAFDDLVEKIAEFMSERNHQLTAGETYLQHGARKLDAGRPIDAIRYLGRAVSNFIKEESREQQHRALYMLAVAYRGADLIWAARSACLAAIGQVSALSEETSETRVELIPTLSMFGLLSLQGGHVSDFLASIQYLGVLHAVLPLHEDSKKNLEAKVREYDQLFACLLVSVDDDELERLKRLPDILLQLGLMLSRLTLMYRLGYQDELRNDGSTPDDEPEDALPKMMSMMAAQPVSKDLPSKVIILDDDYSTLRTSVLGIEVKVSSPTNLQGYLLAEAHVSYLEAFVSTFINQNTFPAVETFNIEIKNHGDADRPTIEYTPEGYRLEVVIPADWDATVIDQHSQFMDHLIEFGTHFLGNALWLSDHEKTLEQVIGVERAFDRATLFSRAGITRHRFFGSFGGTLSDWDQFVKRAYPPLDNAPNITPTKLPETTRDEDSDEKPVLGSLNRHGELSVRSVINPQLWDRARWSGIAYGGSPDEAPPVLALMFRDGDGARAIFNEWKARFGSFDEKDELRISILKGINQEHPFHYRGCIGQDLEAMEADSTKQFVCISRITTMMVDNHCNLEVFLSEFEKWGGYWLVPAVINSKNEPEFVMNLAIAKRKIVVREGWQVGRHDVDAMGIQSDDNVIIPESEKDAPVLELMQWRENKNSSKTAP